MTFLPIVERELRAGARKASPRYVRLIVAAVALVIGLVQIGFIPFFSRGGASGSWAFAVMTGYAFLLCICAGVFVTADCLSEEKREGTLGLLFLTDLRGYDVILGKLASQLVYLGYALLAIIPGAALPLLLGGVTGSQLWHISLALINLLFFSLAVGVFASTVCREAGRAILLAALLLLLFCVGLPILQSQLGSAGTVSDGFWVGWASPALAYLRAITPSYGPATREFWLALGGSHAVAWLFIAAASLLLPYAWQDRVVGRGDGTAPVASGTYANFFSFRSRSKRDRKRLEEDPLLWLIGERRGLRVWLWVFSGIWLAIVATFALVEPLDSVIPIVITGWAGLLITKVLFAIEACRFFAETRRAGAFELLLAAPINANRFVAAQWTALRRLFGAPLLVVVAGTVLSVWGSAYVHGKDYGDMFTITAVGALVGGLLLLVEGLDFVALGWLGMWLALTMRKPQLAAGATILYVLLLPGLVTCYAVFIGFVLDLVLIAVFASKLRADLRRTLMDRPLLLRPGPGGG